MLDSLLINNSRDFGPVRYAEPCCPHHSNSDHTLGLRVIKQDNSVFEALILKGINSAGKKWF